MMVCVIAEYITTYTMTKNFVGTFSLDPRKIVLYEGWNFNSGNYLFTTDTK